MPWVSWVSSQAPVSLLSKASSSGWATEGSHPFEYFISCFGDGVDVATGAVDDIDLSCSVASD